MLRRSTTSRAVATTSTNGNSEAPDCALLRYPERRIIFSNVPRNFVRNFAYFSESISQRGDHQIIMAEPDPTAGGGGGNKNDQMPPAATPAAVSSITSALRLYERDFDAHASLEACRRLWNNNGDGKRSDGKKGEGGGGDDGERAGAEQQLSRLHNEVVLGYLSLIQSRRSRLVRPRPNDDERDADDNNHNNLMGEGENLAGILSSMLAVSKDAKGDDDQAQRVKLSGYQLLLGEYNQLVGLHNVCLSHYANGNYQEGLDATLSPFIDAMKSIKVDSEGVKVNRREDTNTTAAANGTTSIGYLAMTTRIAFLILDCQFSLNGGNGTGLGPIVANKYGDDRVNITTEDILSWIEKTALSIYTSKGEDAIVDSRLLERYDSLKYDELKFRLHLYRSRMLFLGNKDGGGGRVDDLETRTRVSRKELKNAMDIYNNKLCSVEDGNKEHDKKGKSAKPEGSKAGSGGAKVAQAARKSHPDVSERDESTSVTSVAGGSLVDSVSDVVWSEGKGGATRATFEGMPQKNALPQQPISPQSGGASTNAKVKKKDTPELQVRHESVLYLKANLEYLRGNTSKSLKLCAEARSAGEKSRARGHGEKEKSRGDAQPEEKNNTPSTLHGESQMANDYDEAIYYNNLALLHQSAGKIHLALHYYSYALSYIDRVNFLDESCASDTADGAASRSLWSNGTARPDVTAEILHNTSICAFQTQEFNRAYDCMARCVKISPRVFGKRARCWLRLAQSCFGKI